MKLTLNQHVLCMEWLEELVGEEVSLELYGMCPGPPYDHQSRMEYCDWRNQHREAGVPMLALDLVHGLLCEADCDNGKLNDNVTKEYKLWRERKLQEKKQVVKAKKHQISAEDLKRLL